MQVRILSQNLKFTNSLWGTVINDDLKEGSRIFWRQYHKSVTMGLGLEESETVKIYEIYWGIFKTYPKLHVSQQGFSTVFFGVSLSPARPDLFVKTQIDCRFKILKNLPPNIFVLANFVSVNRVDFVLIDHLGLNYWNSSL